jgi:hypothetical protein
MQQPSVLDNEALHAATAELVRSAGLGRDCTLHQLPGGGNNRVFRVDVNGSRALLKAYFQHPEDRRDRLGAEYAFCSFGWDNGLRSLPQPLAQDRANRLGLYEYIEGRKLLPPEVNEGAIRQALAFFLEFNRSKHLPAAQALPVASEAYFALDGHLQCIERRLGVLREIERASAVDREAADFARDQFAPAWQNVRTWIDRSRAVLGLTLEAEIPLEDRCLSPSDLGFHNALLAGNGRLRFLDFEYAGWDDPAKMVCDFFCQVAVSLPADSFAMMVETVAADLSQPQRFRDRVALLMPVYRIKWCCIVLNEFVGVSSRRRQFAGAGADWEEKKAQQLVKARRVLHSVLDDRGIYGLR